MDASRDYELQQEDDSNRQIKDAEVIADKQDYDSDKDNMEKTMTDIEQHLDETIDMEDKHLYAIEKQDGSGGAIIGADKDSTQTQAEESEDSVGGFSSDF